VLARFQGQRPVLERRRAIVRLFARRTTRKFHYNLGILPRRIKLPSLLLREPPARQTLSVAAAKTRNGLFFFFFPPPPRPSACGPPAGQVALEQRPCCFSPRRLVQGPGEHDSSAPPVPNRIRLPANDGSRFLFFSAAIGVRPVAPAIIMGTGPAQTERATRSPPLAFFPRTKNFFFSTRAPCRPGTQPHVALGIHEVTGPATT